MAKLTYSGNLPGVKVGALLFLKGEEVTVPAALAKDLGRRADFGANVPDEAEAIDPSESNVDEDTNLDTGANAE
tara:strand:- start:5088 stop:5309 length:222 start_codon:yes stop_codon:yes gene_type:complete